LDEREQRDKLGYMPKCVQCGVELPREEMFGPNDELRCPACAQRGRAKFSGPRHVIVERRGPVTATIAALAVVCTVVSFFWPPLNSYLVAGPWHVFYAQGQLWRLVTTVFLHDHFPNGLSLHLLFNVYWTIMFGRAIESEIGSPRFLGLLLLLIVGPVAAEVLLGHAVVGLSGVGYGLFGFVFALRRDRGWAGDLMAPHVVQLFIIWFIACFFMPIVANMAHTVGAVLGWSVGRLVLNRPWRAAGLAALTAAVIGLTAAAVFVPLNQRFAFRKAYVVPMAVEVEDGTVVPLVVPFSDE
jgi:membrane associated rhomboid family serine protease